jgi:hypothetical protein
VFLGPLGRRSLGGGGHPHDLPALASLAPVASSTRLLRLRNEGRYEAPASDFFFSAAAKTFIRSRGAAFSTLTSWTIGDCNRNRSFA